MTPVTRQARIQLAAEGVVASYIHDIATRAAATTTSAPPAPARRHESRVHGRAARLSRTHAPLLAVTSRSRR